MNRRPWYAATVLLLVALGAALAVGTAGAKPHGVALPTVPVSGTFTDPDRTATVPFTGTLAVDRFVEADGPLALEATVTADAAGLFDPQAVTVTATAAPAEDPATGDCTVQLGLAAIFLDRGFLLFVEGTTVRLGPDQGLCAVLRATEKDPTDQAAIARALNKALDLG